MVQAVSKGATRKPASVMTTALAAATKTEGILRSRPRVVRSRMVVKASATRTMIGRRAHLRIAGLHDQQNAGKARKRRHPARQADFLAVEDGGAGRHEQRRGLQHRVDGRQRHVAQRNDDEGRGRAGRDEAHAASCGVMRTDSGRAAPSATTPAASRAVASTPLTTMISPEGNSADTSLTMASLTTNAVEAMRTAMMPRRLSVTSVPPLPADARAGRCRGRRR